MSATSDQQKDIENKLEAKYREGHKSYDANDCPKGVPLRIFEDVAQKSGWGYVKSSDGG